MDHQFRINRRATHGRIMRCEFAAKPGQIESSIDLPHQMIFRNRVVELKLVEKLRLSALQPTHHGLPPPRFASARWNHCSPRASTDFCNKICQQRTHGLQQKIAILTDVISKRLFGCPQIALLNEFDKANVGFVKCVVTHRGSSLSSFFRSRWRMTSLRTRSSRVLFMARTRLTTPQFKKLPDRNEATNLALSFLRHPGFAQAL
jgi:hypothetical protein